MISEIKYRIGTMSKSPSKMTDEELSIWQEQGEKEIREYLFSINQPLVYYRNGVLVMEDKNGFIQAVE